MKLWKGHRKGQILSGTKKNSFMSLSNNIFSHRYKREYYINDDNQHSSSPQNSPKHTTPTQVVNNDEIIRPTKKSYEEMTVSMLIGDMDVPQKYTRHDQDYSLAAMNSLTMSEDSDTTRIYTPSTQETKLIAPHAERISTTKGFPVAALLQEEEESEIGKSDDSSIKVRKRK